MWRRGAYWPGPRSGPSRRQQTRAARARPPECFSASSIETGPAKWLEVPHPSSARGIPVTPIMPGPRRCRSRVRPRRRRSARSRRSRVRARPGAGTARGPGCAGRPSRRLRVVELVHVLDHTFECASGGAHALDGRDFVLHRQDRLDLQRAAEPGLGFADAPAAAHVLQRIQAEPDLQRGARLAARGRDGILSAPSRAAAPAASTSRPNPPQTVSPSITSTRSPRPRSPSSPCAWRAASQVPEMPPDEVH